MKSDKRPLLITLAIAIVGLFCNSQGAAGLCDGLPFAQGHFGFTQLGYDLLDSVTVCEAYGPPFGQP